MRPTDNRVARALGYRDDPMQPIGRENRQCALLAHRGGIDLDIVEFQIAAFIICLVRKLDGKSQLARGGVGAAHIDVPIVVRLHGIGIAHEIGHVVGDESAQIKTPAV